MNKLNSLASSVVKIGSVLPSGAWKLLLPLPLLLSMALKSEAQVDAPLSSQTQQKLIENIQVKHRQRNTKTIAAQNKNKLGPILRSLSTKNTNPKNGIESTPLVSKNLNGEIHVVISLSETSDGSILDLERLGVRVDFVYEPLAKVQAWVSVNDIDAVVQLENVTSIRATDQAHSRAGSVVTQGDAILRAQQLRSMGFRGQGIRIGIISDGANDWKAARASGNLPNNLSVYGSCTKRSENVSSCISRLTCNEGTAMAEIIHDLAPSAEIAVAAVSTSLEFVQRLNQLANDFKADIIVDDLGFFGEPYFEDGDLAKAVAALPEHILYVSAAGNSARSHYEAEYSQLTLEDFDFHDFGGNDNSQGFVVPSQGYVVALLQWNDPFANANSDYDLYIVDQTSLVGQSVADQGSGAIALEAVCVANNSNQDVANFALVDKFSGDGDRLEMFFLGSPLLEHPVSTGSIFGHPGVSRALAIGAINASDSGHNSIASYSSRGPARIDFPSVSSRSKPDLAGIDGVSVTGSGGFPSQFFGTSAAAPHVAAVAAQLMSVSPKATADKVKRALMSGAVDLGSSGRDNVFGAGRVDAVRAKIELNLDPIVLPPLHLLLDD